MATPDFDYKSDYIDWSIKEDYDVTDRQFSCSMTGLPKKPGEVVYQGQMIEEEGHFTISQYSAEQLARLIGWVDPDEYDRERQEQFDSTDAELEFLRKENSQLRQRISDLTNVLTDDNYQIASYDDESRQIAALQEEVETLQQLLDAVSEGVG